MGSKKKAAKKVKKKPSPKKKGKAFPGRNKKKKAKPKGLPAGEPTQLELPGIGKHEKALNDSAEAQFDDPVEEIPFEDADELADDLEAKEELDEDEGYF